MQIDICHAMGVRHLPGIDTRVAGVVSRAHGIRESWCSARAFPIRVMRSCWWAMRTRRPFTLNPLLIPSAYAKGGHHFSNGATWIEQYARSVGLGDSVKGLATTDLPSPITRSAPPEPTTTVFT